MYEEVFVGIDIAEDHLDVHVLPKDMHFVSKNDSKDISKLIARLQKERPAIIVMEASGGYEIDVASELGGAGLPVVIVNPRQVRDFARGIGITRKDRQDRLIRTRTFCRNYQACSQAAANRKGKGAQRTRGTPPTTR